MSIPGAADRTPRYMWGCYSISIQILIWAAHFFQLVTIIITCSEIFIISDYGVIDYV